MKTKYFFLAGFAAMLASCANEEYIGDTSPNATLEQTGDGSIQFTYNLPNRTRAGEFVGATAAEKLGGMFVVEGTKGSEQTNSPSTTVVFDNYLVGYTANTAGTAESNTHNWEYVGKQTGITDRMTAATWTALHPSGAQAQSIKYWDYSVDQYDFIAWSTGNREAVTTDPTSGSEVQVTRINTGTTLATNGFSMTAKSAEDLLECYYTDIITAKKDNGAGTDYGKPVTLTFRNMAAKVRVALYETVPGYSVRDVKFYTKEAENPAKPEDLGTGTTTTATLFTLGADNKLPQSGTVTITYPYIGTEYRDTKPTDAYNKAIVTVVAGSAKSSTQTFSTLHNFVGKESYEPEVTQYIGRKVTEATYAGDVTKNYYTAVIPNSTGKPLTLRVDYKLVSTDGSGETIEVKGAKAIVPATYTEWQPNYAYTYIFKISDNSNGFTGTKDDPNGLFPITFDAMVTSFVDANPEQTTITTVATPSITTYQQGHDHANKDEYSKSQTAGASSNKKDLYVQVMDNSIATPTLKNDLNGTNKSLLYAISGTAPISEATVYDALQNRKQTIATATPINGRNGMILTKNTHITNGVETIVNGVNDQPISVSANTTAMIDIDHDGVPAGTYAYVYATTVPSADEVVYNVASVSNDTEAKNYYEVDPAALTATSNTTAQPNKVYFVANLDAQNAIESYTFKQTKVGDSVTGLYEATIDLSTASKATTYTVGHFYFDVYYQNNGAYAVKVIKVVD